MAPTHKQKKKTIHKFALLAIAALVHCGVNAVQLPAGYDISGELRAGYVSQDSGFSTTNSRITVSANETFDNGINMTSNVNLVKLDSRYTVLANVVAQSSFGSMAIGNYQGIDRKWGNLATVTRTLAGDGLFQGESTAISLMTPAYYGFTAGASYNTVKTSDGNKDGSVVGLRYRLKGLAVTATAGKLSDDQQARKQVAISYTNRHGRVAFEQIQRTPTNIDKTASLIVNTTDKSIVYLEKRAHISDSNGAVNSTAVGVRYSASHQTDFVVEKSTSGRSFVGVITRF